MSGTGEREAGAEAPSLGSTTTGDPSLEEAKVLEAVEPFIA
jgi:hypothetical protein